jgi:hypothetical protein
MRRSGDEFFALSEKLKLRNNNKKVKFLKVFFMKIPLDFKI